MPTEPWEQLDVSPCIYWHGAQPTVTDQFKKIFCGHPVYVYLRIEGRDIVGVEKPRRERDRISFSSAATTSSPSASVVGIGVNSYLRMIETHNF